MEVRLLGDSGLSTPPLIFGGNVFGWTADTKTSFAILDAYRDGGGLVIDTADVYSAWVEGNRGGESETILGQWLAARGRRDDVVIATKVGMEMDGSKGLKAQRIAAAIEGSLKRLQTDYVDIYFAHLDDTDTPLEETLGAFDALVRAGKVRAIGASNYDASRLEQALTISAQAGFAAYTILQPEYNLVERSKFEGPLQELCIAKNIGVIPYYSLAAGFLTGKYRSDDDLAGRARGRTVERHLNEQGFRVLQAVEDVSAESGATMAQVALAWLMAQPGVTAPIASATSVSQLEELLGAMRLTLSPAQLDRLTAAGEKF